MWFHGDQDPGFPKETFSVALKLCKDGMVQGGFNCFHFSFKSKELSRENNSLLKVKADGFGKSKRD